MKKPTKTKTTKRPKSKQALPPGWDEKRVQEVIEHYENQTEEEQVAEHEAAQKAQGQTMMSVPTELVPVIRQLIARQRRGV